MCTPRQHRRRVASAEQYRRRTQGTVNVQVVDDDEYWYKCTDCDGGGTVTIPDEPPVEAECPGCEGLGVIQGEADDEKYGFVQVPS